MQEILGYIQEYWKNTDKIFLGLTTLFTAFLVFINYKWQLDHRLSALSGMSRWLAYTCLYIIAFGLPYLIYYFLHPGAFNIRTIFLLIIVITGLFAFKVSSTTIIEFLHRCFAQHKPGYWSTILNIPIKLLVLGASMIIIWNFIQPAGPLLGLKMPAEAQTNAYLWMLLIMVPLIIGAAFLPSFLQYYPKFDKVPLPPTGWKRALSIAGYELSYATDFITIELFFRGLLAIALVKVAGPMAIIPMAAFYCSIHFGKPAGECISSFFGGLLLGILAWRTQSIAGGLFIHIGIAWLMEIAGYIGNILRD